MLLRICLSSLTFTQKRTYFRMGVFDQTVVIFLVSTLQIVWHSYGIVYKSQNVKN